MRRLKYTKRTSLMQLREQHLDSVDSMARSNATPAELRADLCKNYHRYFGWLRPKSKTVPSDTLRQNWMVFEIVDLVMARRDEIAAWTRHEEIAAYDAAYGMI